MRARLPSSNAASPQETQCRGSLAGRTQADVRRKLQNAYAMTDYADAKRALDRLHRELMDLNPSAARSLEEGWKKRLRSTNYACRTSSAEPSVAPT